MVESIRFDSVGKPSFGCRLENSNGMELSYSRRLNDGFSEEEELFAVTLLTLVSFKYSKIEH